MKPQQKHQIDLRIEREAEHYWGKAEHFGVIVSASAHTEEQLLESIKIDLLLQCGLYEYQYNLVVEYV
jgi:hypothetical protein